MRRSLSCGLLLVLLSGVACFTDAAPGGNGEETTGGACPIASLGCPCDGEQCDEGLACEPSVSLCIDPACTPGTLICTCVDGLCLEGLQCDGALCQSPSGDTDTTGPSQFTTSTSETSDPSGGLTDDSESSVSATSGPIYDLGAVPCGELPCADCRECVVAPGGDCRVAVGACNDNPVCAAVADCTLACDALADDCVPNCCTAHGDTMNVQYNSTVASCIEMACTGCSPDLTCQPI